MAREKDEAKRQAILGAAKRLFAERGFKGASMAELAGRVDLPVGSIYTYFENKDALARAVIEEGWEAFFENLSSAIASAAGPERGLALIVYKFLPELFQDLDLIALIVSEAWRLPGGYESVGLEEKLERLVSLIVGLLAKLAKSRGLSFEFPPRRAMAALSLYFLGALDSVRLTRSTSLGFDQNDVVDFIAFSIENSFGLRIDPADLAAAAPADPGLG